MMHRYDYKWTLADAKFSKDKGRVFSCFACGGGSTMGYKLAGFDVIGCNEIDPRMNAVYVRNHNPKYNYLMDIRELIPKARNGELPEELYQLDILDGSPPCSSFSMVGARERDWGKEKHFREGQSSQVLDTLFFDFIELASILKPKVVVAENVKGILLGNAIRYCQRIIEDLNEAGYYTQHFLLDAQNMGVPQRRERTFFVSIRKDIADKFIDDSTLFGDRTNLVLEFNEPIIPFGEIEDGKGRKLTGKMMELWQNRRYGDSNFGEVHTRLYGCNTFFSDRFCYKDEVCGTLTGKEDALALFDSPTFLSHDEVCKASSFPLDYDFMGQKPCYICGMSVPPVMMANIATEIYKQWLVNL